MQNPLLETAPPPAPSSAVVTAAAAAPARRAPALRLVGPVPPELAAGLAEIRAAFPARFAHANASDASATAVRFVARAERGLRLAPGPDAVVIEFSRPPEAFRALAILMGRLASGLAPAAREERAAFESLGFMLDASRNGVLRLESVRKLIRHLALMGLNQLMLYTEDTYEIPGEPQFGYFRGGYTQVELREIDAYAALFGIEVVPCIQTLGHLEQILQWPAYSPLQDTDGVLLAGDAGTEALVEKMLLAASAPFRSRRIHIGMDEAHGIGSGQYRFRNGLRAPFDILTDHLDVVAALCAKHGLDPMIWSDMFFRLGSKTNQYYDRASSISPEVAAKIPASVELVYWDYYHTDREFYLDWIDRHRAMGKEPLFAAGIWTWNRSWAQLPHSLATLRAGMSAARERGLREAFVTAWGDDGMECDAFSVLPAMQFFAEQAYAPDEADANLEVHFRGSCAADAHAWIAASDLDCPPGAGEPAAINANHSKWLLWHDPLLNFFDKHIPSASPAHYARLAARCEEWGPDTEDSRLAYVGHVAAVLALKTALHLALRPAYRAGDRATLARIAEHDVPALRERVRALWTFHRELWHATYKAFGWEVVEHRYGGLLARLDTLQLKLRRWLDDPAAPIEELACESHEIFSAADYAELSLTHHRASTTSRVF